MPEFRISIPGRPFPKNVKGGKYGWRNGKNVRQWMDTCRDFTLVAMHKAEHETIPRDVPVRVVIVAFFDWAKNTPKYAIEPDPYAPMLEAPDWDNVAKPICDGITEAGFWADDRQVWKGSVETRRCPRGEQGAEVIVYWDEVK